MSYREVLLRAASTFRRCAADYSTRTHVRMVSYTILYVRTTLISASHAPSDMFVVGPVWLELFNVHASINRGRGADKSPHEGV